MKEIKHLKRKKKSLNYLKSSMNNMKDQHFVLPLAELSQWLWLTVPWQLQLFACMNITLLQTNTIRDKSVSKP